MCIRLILKVVLLTVILMFFFTGWALDNQAKRTINQLYERNPEGIIKGSETIEHINNHSKAIVFLHGLGETPEIFQSLVNKIQKKNVADIYVPLLPNHGRNLESFNELNYEESQESIKKYIIKILQKYEHVTFIGISSGNLYIFNGMYEGWIPENSVFIAISPAIFIKDNNYLQRIKVYLYSLWRTHCNYESLCQFPVFYSGDSAAKNYLRNEKSLRFFNTKNILKLYDFDSDTRVIIDKIKIPFHIAIAVDDNRIDYDKVASMCNNHEYCTLHTFSSGKHILPHSVHKEKLYQLIMNLM